MSLEWLIDGDSIQFSLTGPAGKWLGVGTSEDGSMIGADILIGWTTDTDYVMTVRTTGL